MALKNDLYINVEPYSEVLGGLSFVLSISNGVVKLLGHTGTGKTALCIELLGELKKEKIEFVHFPDAPDSFSDVEKAIKEKLKLQVKAEGDKESFIQALTAHIIKKSFDEQKLVLIFDDVENLNKELLAELTAFRHIHLNDQGLVSIVLSGTPAMESNIKAAASSLVSDLLVSYTLEPMNKEQLAVFCEAYLEEIKMKANLTDENISQLLEITEGLPGTIPEMIPEILDQDSSKLYVRKKRQKELVKKATKTLTHEFVDPFADEETQKQVVKRWKWPVGPAFIAAGISVGVFFVYAAYVFLPEDIIPATVSYFGDQVDDAVVAVGDAPEIAPAVVEVPSPLPEAETADQLQLAEVAPEQLAVPEPQTDVPDEQTPENELLAETEIAEPAEDEVFVSEPEIETPAEASPAPQVAEVSGTEAPEPETAPVQAVAGDEVEAAIQQWLAAWSAQDTTAYFDAYHEAFEPQSFSSQAAWRNQRQRNIQRPGSIAISYDDYMVLSRSVDSTMVTLEMEYRSPTYADRTVKLLGLIRDPQSGWKIIHEENLQVQRLPVNRPASEQVPDRLQVILSPQLLSASEVPAIDMSPGTSAGNLDSEQLNLFNFVNDWLVAWQRQDINAYFNHYQDNYRGFNFTTPQAWEQDRMLKISRPSYIELSMSDFEILRESSQEALVQFSLEYRSAYYADRTLKEVLLRRDQRGNLRIANELNRQIELLPIYRRIESALALF